MRSKQSIIEQHLAFCAMHNITVTQQQRNAWSITPARVLAKILANDRLEISRGWSQHTTATFN